MFSTKPSLYEVPSPKIRIKDGDVNAVALQGGVIFKGLKDGFIVSTVADTGSMDPLIDIGMMVILEPVTDTSDLIVGDIICYQKPGTPTMTLHRIVKLYVDKDGWWCHTKGDNDTYTDPDWIAAEWVKYLYRGVLC